MFVRLLVYAGCLALLCVGLVGCGDEDPASSVETVPEEPVVKAVAKLVKTEPASGGDASEYFPVVLYFDKEPLAVTVNGTAARVQGNKAFWCFPNPQKLGNQLFHIKWTNPDGSLNVGNKINLTVWTVLPSEPSILGGTVSNGDADVDPDSLHGAGIRFDFDEPVVGLKAELLNGDGEDLGWLAIWDDQTLELLPTANGKLLENGRRYMIHMVVDEPWIYNEISCECMDCSWYESSEWTIEFVTVDE